MNAMDWSLTEKQTNPEATSQELSNITKIILSELLNTELNNKTTEPLKNFSIRFSHTHFANGGMIIHPEPKINLVSIETFLKNFSTDLLSKKSATYIGNSTQNKINIYKQSVIFGLLFSIATDPQFQNKFRPGYYKDIELNCDDYTSIKFCEKPYSDFSITVDTTVPLEEWNSLVLFIKDQKDITDEKHSTDESESTFNFRKTIINLEKKKNNWRTQTLALLRGNSEESSDTSIENLPTPFNELFIKDKKHSTDEKHSTSEYNYPEIIKRRKKNDEDWCNFARAKLHGLNNNKIDEEK